MTRRTGLERAVIYLVTVGAIGTIAAAIAGYGLLVAVSRAVAAQET